MQYTVKTNVLREYSAIYSNTGNLILSTSLSLGNQPQRVQVSSLAMFLFLRVVALAFSLQVLVVVGGCYPISECGDVDMI